MYNNHDAFFKEIECYSNLYAEWQFNRWELKELDKICSKIDEGLQELNPYFFYGGKKFAMLTILKVGIYLKQMFRCAPLLFFLEIEALFQFQRYERLCRLLITCRRAVMMVLNDPDLVDNARLLYICIFASRIAQPVLQMREIFDSF